MGSLIISKIILSLNKKSQAQGFTLIELLVVVMIAGILAAVSVPNFIRQAGKAREVEYKNSIGMINRAQQAYHWEKEVFASGANDAAVLSLLNVSFNNKYITSYNLSTYPTHATVAPQNLQYNVYQTRAYSGGIFYSGGAYKSIICQGFEISDSQAPPITPEVCSDGQQIK